MENTNYLRKMHTLLIIVLYTKTFPGGIYTTYTVFQGDFHIPVTANIHII